MCRLLQRLEVQARLDRFGHDPGDAALEACCRASLAASPAIFGAFAGGRLVGIAEITGCRPDNVATFAFVVEPKWRRKGIGRRLLLAALEWADRRGAMRVQLQCTRTNWAVRRIAHKAQARINLAAGNFIAEFNTQPQKQFADAANAHQ